MKYRVIFKEGENHKLIRSTEKNNEAILLINKNKIKSPYDLCNFVAGKLCRFKELEIDLDSWRQIQYENVSDESRDLIIPMIHSAITFIPWSAKSKPEKNTNKWELISHNNQKIQNIIKGIEFAKKLQATPPNILSPEKFVCEVKDFFKDIPQVKIKEICGKELEKEKLNLIIAVGKASVNAPRLLLLEYIPNPEGEVSALVGKGICYDSGGLNIKTGPYMSTMKFDMSGGAVSAGVMYAIAKNQSKKNLVVAIPLAENAISGISYRPDDVIISRSGKSIEIDNTDAEGRLVLADAMSYTIDIYKPSEIITIATLTGAIGYALGNKYGGAWSTCCKRWENFKKCTDAGFEFVWRMPWDDYYIKALKKSKVADIKNSARTGTGGASRAACFLKEFSNNLPYIHLDIANIAHSNEDDEPRAPLLRSLYFYLFS